MPQQKHLNRTHGKPCESIKMNVSGDLDMRAQIRSVLLERLEASARPHEDEIHICNDDADDAQAPRTHHHERLGNPYDIVFLPLSF